MENAVPLSFLATEHHCLAEEVKPPQMDRWVELYMILKEENIIIVVSTKNKHIQTYTCMYVVVSDVSTVILI